MLQASECKSDFYTAAASACVRACVRACMLGSLAVPRPPSPALARPHSGEGREGAQCPHPGEGRWSLTGEGVRDHPPVRVAVDVAVTGRLVVVVVVVSIGTHILY